MTSKMANFHSELKSLLLSKIKKGELDLPESELSKANLLMFNDDSCVMRYFISPIVSSKLSQTMVDEIEVLWNQL